MEHPAVHDSLHSARQCNSQVHTLLHVHVSYGIWNLRSRVGGHSFTLSRLTSSAGCCVRGSGGVAEDGGDVRIVWRASRLGQRGHVGLGATGGATEALGDVDAPPFHHHGLLPGQERHVLALTAREARLKIAEAIVAHSLVHPLGRVEQDLFLCGVLCVCVVCVRVRAGAGACVPWSICRTRRFRTCDNDADD